jgi:hypothetical protein
MARRIIAGTVLTFVLLVGVRQFSTHEPVLLVAEGPGMKIYHRTVTERVGPGQPLLTVGLEPAQRVSMVVRWVSPPSSTAVMRNMIRVRPNRYEFYLPDLGKGARVRYWIEAKNGEGTKLRLPDDPDRFVTLRFKGTASKGVLVAHVAFMFGAFFFMVLSLFGAIRILRGREGKKGTVNAARWVLILSFIGSCPLGFILNHQMFGVLWEGYPFGYDVTDNKTQVVFILWLVSLLLAWGSFTGRGEEKDRIGARAFAWAVIASFLVSLALFILPHSI